MALPTPRGDVKKLAKWAQEYITLLERNLEHAYTRLGEGPEGANVFADPFADPPRPLGHDTKIQFVVEPATDRRVAQYFEAHLDGHILVVRGCDLIAIRPQSSNLIRIELSR